MDYEKIINENHDQYIKDIVRIINNNLENKKISFFIETIMQSNKEEYKLLCNALYRFITSQGGGMATENAAAEKAAADSGFDIFLQEAEAQAAEADSEFDNFLQAAEAQAAEAQAAEAEEAKAAAEAAKAAAEAAEKEAAAAQAQATESSLVVTTNNTKPEESSTEATTPIADILIEKLKQITSPIKIPHKNKLLIDEQFELKEEESENINYKYYLSFYIIDAINNITVSSSGL